MYTIKQASMRSGVGVPLIRAWERRYGVVKPIRAASGYRLYDDEAIARLVLVRRLTETGWNASEASRAVLAGEAPALSDPRGASQSTAMRRDDLVSRFVEAAVAVDLVGTGSVLDEVFALGSYEAVVDDVLTPALVALGDAWADGRLDVAAEHAATAAVHRRLAAHFDAAARGAGTDAVVGLPPGCRHELGALCFAVALRRLGIGVLYLGADVPVRSWVEVVRRVRGKVAIVGVVTIEDQAPALDVVRAIRAEATHAVVATGGHRARWDAAVEAGAIVLPDRISESAGIVARLATT